MFDPVRLSFLDWGMVIAYPMIWGTHYLDNQWYLSGSNDWKIQHILDFIDMSIFLKEKITKKIGIYATNPSGGLTALTSSLREPFLFDSVVTCNPITNLPLYCLKYSDKNIEHTWILNEYGDATFREIYEIQKLMSPFHIPIDKIQTDILI